MVFSHAEFSTGQNYQLLAQEFASNGYIVFVIDHLCGSSSHFEHEDGEVQSVDTRLDFQRDPVLVEQNSYLRDDDYYDGSFDWKQVVE